MHLGHDGRSARETAPCDADAILETIRTAFPEPPSGDYGDDDVSLPAQFARVSRLLAVILDNAQ